MGSIDRSLRRIQYQGSESWQREICDRDCGDRRVDVVRSAGIHEYKARKFNQTSPGVESADAVETETVDSSAAIEIRLATHHPPDCLQPALVKDVPVEVNLPILESLRVRRPL